MLVDWKVGHLVEKTVDLMVDMKAEMMVVMMAD